MKKSKIKKKWKTKHISMKHRKKQRKICQEPEPLILCEFISIGMGGDKDEYVKSLCHDIKLGFEDLIYDIEPKDLCLFIEKDNIWSTKVARYEAKSELSYYKFIRFSDIGNCDEKGNFTADTELVRKFVDENFDKAYFD